MTVVFTAGRFLRMLVTGQTSKIVNEDLPNVDKVLKLCDALLTAREMGDHEKEEILYWLLIDLFRSPERLRERTKIS